MTPTLRHTLPVALLCTVAAGIALSACTGGSKPSGAGVITMAFVGDTHGYNIVGFDSQVGGDILGGVRGVLDGSDVFVFNHEAALVARKETADRCGPITDQSTFAVPTSFAAEIELEGLAVAGMANNHALDCGPDGLAQTADAFGRSGIAVVGAGLDAQEACKALEVDVHGLRLAFLAYFLPAPEVQSQRAMAASPGAAGVATMDACDGYAALEDVRERADLVVVLLHAHAGSSRSGQPAAEQAGVARELLQRGADLVVGHGPHYPQGLFVEDGGLALLSLGNFMFRPDYEMPPEAHRSFIALVEVEEGRPSRVRIHPIEITAEGLPVIASEQESVEILDQVEGLSRIYGTTISSDDGIGLVDVAGRTE